MLSIFFKKSYINFFLLKNFHVFFTELAQYNFRLSKRSDSVKVGSNFSKSAFNKLIRLEKSPNDYINPIFFSNFKRVLSTKKDNSLPFKKFKYKLVSKYFFQKKKIFFRKSYTEHNGHIVLSLLGNSKLLDLHALASAKRVSPQAPNYLLSKKKTKRKLFSKRYIIFSKEIRLPNKYSTLKTHSRLKKIKVENKKNSPITKKLRRVCYRQFRYATIFWSKLNNVFSKKNKPRRKRVFFKTSFTASKLSLRVFNNKFSLYPLNFSCASRPLNFFKKSSPAKGLLVLNIFFKRSKLACPTHNIFLIKNMQGISHSRIGTKSNLSLHNSFTKSFIFTKYNNSFIMHKNGLSLPYKFKFKFPVNKAYRVKKIFYSFLRTNELKKTILDSRKKLIYNKIVSVLKVNKFLFKRVISRSQNALTLLNSNLYVTLNTGSVLSSDKITSEASKLSLGRKNAFGNELRIPRVRFKPGYQRLWRNFRLAFAESVDFRYIYQQQLTKYLMRFYRKLNQTYFDLHENNVQKVLIYSRLVPDKDTFNTFFNSKIIYLNGSVLTNKEIFIYKNDFIQLEISNWYYIFSRWLTSLVMKRNLKFRALVFRKSLAGRYKVMKQVKQRSNYTPKWIFTTKYDLSDIKPFLEVDFFTLSLFYIYEHNLLLYYTPNNIKIIRYNLFRLYNWKYIN